MLEDINGVFVVLPALSKICFTGRFELAIKFVECIFPSKNLLNSSFENRKPANAQYVAAH